MRPGEVLSGYVCFQRSGWLVRVRHGKGNWLEEVEMASLDVEYP